MSQHFFDTDIDGIIYTVQIGWDKPLQRFYLMIDNAENDNSEDYFYSNLEDRQCKHTLEYFASVLEQNDISIPEGLLDAVEKDRINNTVNKVYRYD